jgi:putative ABC transport system permease protein
MLTLAAFAIAALALAAIGVYGVVAFQITQRTREIAVRIALGARGADVMWLVVRQGLTPVVVGLVVGLAGALALSRYLGTLLFDIGAADPTTFAVTASILIAAAAIACLLPSRRAVRTEPAVALQNE